MITIDWKSLNAVGQEYFDRLLMYAKAHPRSYLYTRIVSVIDLETFRDLILCPPLRLEKYPCSDGLSPDDIYSIYDLFFAASGLDNENNAVWLTSKLNIKVCNKIVNYDITLDSLEAGEEAYTERKGIYETLKN